ncbi:glycosyltransferase family 4 protein [Kaistella palustris]|uniref:glycosyltransferase family 4 protein n=1 Tax=Kaistella palustris TaxID=493376 RepID=UPI000423DDEA|nr:glycosyltransferase family 4 protein [Kaistella palustris]
MKYKLIISCVFPPEPTVSGQVMFDVATALSETGKVKVITPKPTRPFNFKFDEKRVASHNFEHLVTDSFTSPQMTLLGRYKESKSFGKWCYDYITENHKDIELVYMNAWPLFSQEAIIKAAKKYNIPCVTIIQDIYPESLTNKLPVGKGLIQSILLKKDRFILQNSTKVLCISDNMKAYLAKTRNLPLDHFSVIVNWQDENTFIQYLDESTAAAKHTENTPFTYMYLGNNGPVAGVEFLIECFVKAAVPNSRLVIAGSGSKKEDCENLAKSLNAHNVEFMSVPEGKVPQTQAIADVMLLPVKKNGAYSSIPSKLPAYMFSKKPIIGSLDVDSDTAKAISDADAGIVVEPEDPEKLVGAIREIASWSSEKIQQKGENGFKYAMENFSKSGNLKKITKIIESL